MSLKRGECDISIFSLSVESMTNSWLEGVTNVLVVPVLDLKSLGVSDFFLWLILDLNVLTSCLNWNLPSSNLRLGLGLDDVFYFIVKDLDISESFFFSVSSVGMNRSFLVVLDGYGVDSTKKASNIFHLSVVV